MRTLLSCSRKEQIKTSGHLIIITAILLASLIVIIPPAQRSCWGGGGGGGYIGFTPSVRLSVRPSVRPSVPRPSRIPRLQFWLDPFHIYASYKATSEGVSRAKFLAKFWQFFKICNFDFVLFWLGMWCESLVWVIMGRRGVSQNAGVLVVLVESVVSIHMCTSSRSLLLS